MITKLVTNVAVNHNANIHNYCMWNFSFEILHVLYKHSLVTFHNTPVTEVSIIIPILYL